ncbi:MAG: hypothetical protein QGG90_12885 [Nitrospinota bacterium]|nr:hypothetical protein [Nitrospinota bacterium]
MKKTVALTLLSLSLLAGCGYFKGTASRKGSPARESDSLSRTRKKTGPCPSFLVVSKSPSRIEGVWLTNRALPYKMRVGGKPRVLPGLRDVSEILLVLDDWQMGACKSKLKSNSREQAKLDRKLARVNDYLRAFTLVLSTPYTTSAEAEEEIRKWVKEVRDLLLRELMRGAR